jgi:hypothetical protein
MKKILPLLLLISLFSCDKAEIVNELVGTKWMRRSGPYMSEVKEPRPDGGYDMITFQSTYYNEITFTSDNEGVSRSWSVGGGEKYEWEHIINFTYTYRNKKGSFEISQDGFNASIDFEISNDLKNLYSYELGDHVRMN